MAFYDTTWWLVLTGFFVAVWAVFMIAETTRPRLVEGSRARYLVATVSWASAYPALGAVFLGALQHAAAHQGFNIGAAVDGILLTIWLYAFYLLKKSDDDNWFHRTGTRLRQRLAAHQMTLVPISNR